MEILKIGERVRIVRVKNPDVNDRVSFVGCIGVITKSVKSRRVYKLDLDDGRTWEASMENVEPLATADYKVQRDAVAKYARDLLNRLDNITSDQFMRGGERAERENLRTILNCLPG